MKERVLLLLFVLLAFTGCAEDDRIEWPPTGQPTEGRTLIYYMVCDNDLSGYIYKNLMQAAGTEIRNPNDRVVAFIDHASKGTVLSTEPQIIQFDGNGYHRILKTYPEGNSCDPAFFREVLDYIIAAFPSQSYGLVLSSHGSGWSYDVESSAKSFGGDYLSVNEKGYMIDPRFINIKSLAEQLPLKFEFILFDACLMANAEVAYELKDKANYLLASTITISGKGFAYDTIQPYLLINTDAGLKSAADWFYNYYANSGNSSGAAVSVLDLSQIAGLASVQNELFDKYKVTGSLLQSVKKEGVIVDMRLNGKSFATIPFYDEIWANRYCYDYLDFMKTLLGADADANDLKKLSDQLNKVVIHQQHTNRFNIAATVTNEKFVIEENELIEGGSNGIYSINMEQSSGLSTYIPFAQFFDADERYIINHNYYKQLGWYGVSGIDKLFSGQ